MDLVLQNHNAKPACEAPDGLCELCADISREVIRYQPCDIYCFVADYLDALLITRVNTNIAIKVVENVAMKSEQIAEILALTGLELKEIAAAMPRLRQAFKDYLDAIEAQKNRCGCDVDSELGDECEVSVTCLLRDIGVSYKKAQSAAIKIQTAFRGHYERMQLARQRGEICWQRAAVTTIEILRKAGATRSEASHAATVIQAVYRGYYTRRNMKTREERRREQGIVEPKEMSDMDSWMFMLFECHGLTLATANKAALIIQCAYREYQKRKYERDLLISLSKVSSRRDELSTTSTDVASFSKDSARKRDGILSVTESSEDDAEVKVKALRFQSAVQVSILEIHPVDHDEKEEEVINIEDDPQVLADQEEETHRESYEPVEEETVEHTDDAEETRETTAESEKTDESTDRSHRTDSEETKTQSEETNSQVTKEEHEH